MKIASRKNLVHALALALLSLALLHGCEADTDEDKVRKTLNVIEKGVEEKDVREVLSRISKTYLDAQGNDFAGIKSLILFYFFKHPAISVLLHDVEIKVEGSGATAAFQAILSGSPGKSFTVLPEAVGVYDFHVVLVRESDEWVVRSASWKRFDEGLAVRPE